MNLIFSEFGTAIASKDQGFLILEKIREKLSTNPSVILDITGVDIMTTFCAKQIFGTLYLELGPEKFFKNIQFKGASNDMKIIIEQSIQNAVESQNNSSKNPS